jgi:hypothetical protein
MMKRSDGRLEDVGVSGQDEGRGEVSPMEQSWLSREKMAGGGRDGSSVIDRYVSTVLHTWPLREGFGLSWDILSSVRA